MGRFPSQGLPLRSVLLRPGAGEGARPVRIAIRLRAGRKVLSTMFSRNILFSFSVVFLSGAAGAQLSGTYTIGPSGTYKTFSAAASDLAAKGVKGPVTFLVPPFKFTESFTLRHVPGASAANKVTFKSIVPRMARLTGASGPTLTFAQGTSSAPVAWYVIDGFEFTGGPSYAIAGNRYVYDIEIKNCSFLAAHANRLWYVNGSSKCSRWKVHNNKFKMIPGTYGLYLSQISYWEIHHNSFDMNGCSRGLFFINLNRAYNKIWDNLFYGNVSGTSSYNAALHVAASNYENMVVHNTFLVNTTANAIYTQGYSSGINHFHDNIVMVLGGGTCMRVYYASNVPKLSLYTADNNIYWAPGGAIGHWDKKYTTLASWKAAVAAYNAAKDAKSRNVDPLLAKTGVPYDLHILPASPARDAALYTPKYVIDDYEGNPRGAKADIGAYEIPAGFLIYGKACPGSGNFSPSIGSQGSAAVGSANFAVTLARALGGTGAILSIGSTNRSWGSITLPFPLGGGCSIYNKITLGLPITVQGTGPGNGTAKVLLPIPNNSALAGGKVYFQWLVADSQAPDPFGLVTSQGGVLAL